MSFTEEHTIDGREFVFRTRLNFEQWESIPDSTRMIALIETEEGEEGDEITEAVSEAIRERRMEIVPNASYRTGLLALYLDALEVDGKLRRASKKRIAELPPHIGLAAFKIAINHYEAQKAEMEELDAGNPTVTV